MKTIINNINSISGRYGTHEVFSDWVRMMSLALANACPLHKNKTWKERERAFKDTSSKYTEEEFTKLAESMAHLIKELEREPRDVLGEVYMAGGFGNNKTGQFFTPYHLSELTARLGVNIPEKDDDGLYRIYEPSCGAGGMIIAAVMELFEKGVNYQREVKVVAQDLDWTDEMIKALIKEELKEAELNNGALFKSAHEAYAVTLEEVEELTERINDIHVIQGIIWERNIRKDEYSSYDIYLRLLKAAAEEAIKEAVQVAAMAQKALNTLEAEE